MASGEVLEQMLQVCEQDMNAADGAVAELRRGRVLVGKRMREEAMAAAEAEAAEVFAAEAEVAAVRWMAAEAEVVAVEAKAAAERWLAALFCRWLKAAGYKASTASAVEPAADGSWWEVVDSSTVEGAGRAKELGGALQAFATTVEVAGAPGDGQLDIQLGDLGLSGWLET